MVKTIPEGVRSHKPGHKYIRRIISDFDRYIIYRILFFQTGAFMGDYFIYYGLTLIALIVTLGAQIYISASWSKYSRVASCRGISGAMAARMMLDRYGLRNVGVTKINGNLTDHYDPRSKQIRLSAAVHDGTSIAAVAVACHECGHAVQDSEEYAFLRFRSALVPVTRVSSYLGYIAIVVGILFSSYTFIYVGIIAELVILLFGLVTLPVEFNASRRALAEIKDSNFLVDSEYSGARTMLTAAALTYVAGVIASLLQVLRLIAIFGRKNRR